MEAKKIRRGGEGEGSQRFWDDHILLSEDDANHSHGSTQCVFSNAHTQPEQENRERFTTYP